MTHRRPYRLETIKYDHNFIWPYVTQEVINSTLDGLRNGQSPVRDDLSPFYFMPDSSGERIASVFIKRLELDDPRDPFVEPEERASRELAAYLLDHPRIGRRRDFLDEIGFAGVPVTAMVRCLDNGRYFENKKWTVGSLQMFVRGDYETTSPSCYPVDEVHKITVLDMRLANSRRNRDDILGKEERGKIRLTPINHGSCFPFDDDDLDDLQYVWKDWPQSKVPYSPETVEYVGNLDAETDIEYLQSFGWKIGSGTALVLRVCTMLLKEGVKRNFTPFHIANIMTKRDNPDDLTDLQIMLLDAAETAAEDGAAFMQALSNTMKSHLDDPMKWLHFSAD